MIQLFETKNNRIIEKQPEFGGGIKLKDQWIHLENPTDREIELIERVTGVDESLLKAALDEEERARIEVDDGDTLVLFDIPTIEEEEDYYSYSTMPLGVISTKNSIITVCLKENSVINNFMSGRVKGLKTERRDFFLYQLLYHTHVKYLQYLRQIDRSSQRIQTELHRATKNKELVQLLDLEKSLVYFSTSLRGNSIVIERLSRMNRARNDEDAEELIEDVVIENRQAMDMCNIYSDILASTMSTYASVISNNQNSIMKTLTIMTVIISVPTLFASFWGMNTGVPFEGKQFGFWVVLGLSAIVASVVGYFIIRHNKGIDSKKNKK
ncbi:MAG: magnesium transporter CorA family protein [Clostridia bacterium]|nr:magnesium transporter CorA family protein [Clostridia bacterium]